MTETIRLRGTLIICSENKAQIESPLWSHETGIYFTAQEFVSVNVQLHIRTI